MYIEKILQRLVIVFLLTAGACLLYFGNLSRIQAQESVGWEKIPGVIVSSRYYQKHFRKRYVYAVSLSYQFRVNAVSHSDTTYSFADRDTWFYGEKDAQAFVNQYASGSAVVVYYNPLSNKSVLKPGIHGANNGLVSMALGIVSILGACCFLVPLIQERVRAKPRSHR